MKTAVSNFIEKTKKHKTLVQNISYLSLLQIFNLLLPFITYPYLIRVLGKETYGKIVFVQAIMYYFVVFVNFGFNISVTKEISINRKHNRLLNQIASSIFIMKGMLFILVSIISILIVIYIPRLQSYQKLFFLTLWMCLYEFIFPVWFFQGIEKMKYITFINIIARSTFTILIFIFIKSQSDYLLVPTFNGVGAILAGAISSYILFFRYKIKFVIPKISMMKKLFTDGSQLLMTSITGIIKDKSNTIIIGFFLGMGDVALYDLADKVVNLFSNAFYTIGNALFPNYANNKNKNLLKKVLLISMLLSIAIYLLLLVTLPFIIRKLVSPSMVKAINVFSILGLLIILRNLSYITGTVVLISEGYIKEIVLNMILSALTYLILIGILYLIHFLNLFSIATALVISVLFEFLHRWYYCKRYNLLK